MLCLNQPVSREARHTRKSTEANERICRAKRHHKLHQEVDNRGSYVKLGGLLVYHTREVTGSSPVSPILAFGAVSHSGVTYCESSTSESRADVIFCTTPELADPG